ncbi:hypothetical protein ANN_05711 [Periplaneta americana]|uniref:Reverse transcriptase domain-containing protein n=1 Tax=Periplaneta americana TaxID=6978 RepID=A0ABQ8TBJ6_PERAM|nr:hypothetical protein ANN_05711 [Periplaneta americana]
MEGGSGTRNKERLSVCLSHLKRGRHVLHSRPYCFNLKPRIRASGLHQLLVYEDDVNMLGENPQTIRENTEILLEPSKDIGLEVNPEKTKYMIMSRDENIVRNGNIKIGNLSFEEVENFKYLGATVTNINDTREEIKHRINMGNACYYSVEKLLSSSLLSKNLKEVESSGDRSGERAGHCTWIVASTVVVCLHVKTANTQHTTCTDVSRLSFCPFCVSAPETVNRYKKM